MTNERLDQLFIEVIRAASVCKDSVAAYDSLIRCPIEAALRPVFAIDRQPPLANSVVCFGLRGRRGSWIGVVYFILQFFCDCVDDDGDCLLEGLEIVSTRAGWPRATERAWRTIKDGELTESSLLILSLRIWASLLS